MPWSERESEADEHELSLDEHGRTAISGTCDYRPRVWDGVVAEAAVPGLVADCKAAYLKVTTQTAMTGITYSTNATYWVGADTTPRTALERFALSVFQFHSRRAHFDPKRSGAEWWTQVVSARDAEVGTIGFHWDRDYDLQYDQGLCDHAGVHPHLATVTYLCGGGAPTVVLPVASPVDAAAVPDACCRAVRSAHACWPRPGRHLAFDGRMLHGAPLGLAAAAGGEEGSRTDGRGAGRGVGAAGGAGSEDGAGAEGDALRVTLLVNVWLNHVPWAADPLHAEAAAQMSAPPPAVDLSRPNPHPHPHPHPHPYPNPEPNPNPHPNPNPDPNPIPVPIPNKVDLSRPHAPSRRAFVHGVAPASTDPAPAASVRDPTADHGRACRSARCASTAAAATATAAAATATAAAAAAEEEEEEEEVAAVAGRWEVTHVGGDLMSLVLPTATAAAPHWGDGTDSGDGFVALAFRGDGTAALERAPPPASKTKRKR